MRKIVRAMMLTALTITAMLYVAYKADDTAPVRNGCVIGSVFSGDSLSLNCGGAGEILFQIAGLDTPNIAAPGCAEELAHGTLAAERLQSLIGAGEIRIERLEGRNIPPLIRVSVDGVDVAERLVREGLAVASLGNEQINWCEKLGAQ